MVTSLEDDKLCDVVVSLSSYSFVRLTDMTFLSRTAFYNNENLRIAIPQGLIKNKNQVNPWENIKARETAKLT